MTSYQKIGGVTQIDVRIPSGIQTGSAVPVVVKSGREHVSSQAGVTIAVPAGESNRNRYFDRVGNRGDHRSGRKRLLHQFEQRV